MRIMFYGIYGIENIKTINKHRLELEELNNKLGIDHDSFKDYDRMKKILDEIHSTNYEEPWIFAEYSDRPNSSRPEYLFKDKHVNWFIENKCCWRDKQYRLDRYYKIHLDRISPEPAYMAIVVLKQVMYVKGHDELQIIVMNNNLKQEVWEQPHVGDNIIPPPIRFTTMKETDQEFKDAYIVIRRN